MSAYNTYEEMYNKTLSKCCKFTEGETVRNNKAIEDKYGILDANSILIITKIKLTDDAENKVRKGNENINSNDISYLCYEPNSHEKFYIQEEYLTEAKDKKAKRVARKYSLNQWSDCISSGIATSLKILIPVGLFTASLAIICKNFILI